MFSITTKNCTADCISGSLPAMARGVSCLTGLSFLCGLVRLQKKKPCFAKNLKTENFRRVGVMHRGMGGGHMRLQLVTAGAKFMFPLFFFSLFL